MILLKENIENNAIFTKWSSSLTVFERMETGKKEQCLWKSEMLAETEIRHENKVLSFASWKIESITEHIVVTYDFASCKVESFQRTYFRNIILHDERWNNKMELTNVTCNFGSWKQEHRHGTEK